jgi:undecaprenyl-diphosphatase
MIHDIFSSVILGIVEGITEFLPISSTGHLILVNQFFSFEPQFTNLFDIVIQSGAILAVIIYFRKKILPIYHPKEQQKNIYKLWQKVFVAVIPAFILGALFKDTIERVFFNPTVVIITLILGGIIIFIVEKNKKESSIFSIENLSYKTSFLIGLFQCIAMIPGVSRSASTIIGAMLISCSRTVAVEFSFYLAIPTIIAASGYSFLKANIFISFQHYILLFVGFIISFVVAFSVIAFFMRYIQKNNFNIFGYYRIVLGIIAFLYFLLPSLIK